MLDEASVSDPGVLVPSMYQMVASFPRRLMVLIFPLIQASVPENGSQQIMFYKYAQQV